jgi:hypothetical protein
MKTQSFKLFELLNLEAELAGATNNQTGEKIIEGLLNQKLPVVTKYHLNNLVEEFGIKGKRNPEEVRTINKVKNKFIDSGKFRFSIRFGLRNKKDLHLRDASFLFLLPFSLFFLKQEI